MTSWAEAASAPYVERRARRLVTLQVRFQVEGAGDVRLAGYSTGLNEHGIAGRVNVTQGSLPSNPEGLPVRLILDLPQGALQGPIDAEIVRVGGSWVPGHRYFIALRFRRIPDEALRALRAFITWREDAYFTSEAPPRLFYLYAPSTGGQFGPLTSVEAERVLRDGALGPGGLLWAARRGEWTAFTAEAFRAEASPAIPPVPTAEARGAAATTVPTAEVRAAGARLAGRAAGIGLGARAALFALLLAVAAAGWWIGWLDPSEPARLYREAAALRREGHDHLAVQRLSDLMHRYRTGRWYARAEAAREEALRGIDRARDLANARARLEVFLKVPEERRAQPAVLNNIGDCYYRLGEYERAEAFFQKALAFGGVSDRVRYNLGTTLARLGKWEEAVTELESITGSLAGRPEVHLNAGIAYLALGDREAAVRAFDRATQVAPEDVSIRFAVEEALRSAGAAP